MKAIIIIASVIAFVVVNSKFLREDPDYRDQNKEQKMFSDPLGLRRFREQPKKMTILTLILVGPILCYYLYQTLTLG